LNFVIEQQQQQQQQQQIGIVSFLHLKNRQNEQLERLNAKTDRVTEHIQRNNKRMDRILDN
jgi:hypothetical protein